MRNLRTTRSSLTVLRTAGPPCAPRLQEPKAPKWRGALGSAIAVLGLCVLLLGATPGGTPIALPGAPQDVFFADAGHLMVVTGVPTVLDGGSQPDAGFELVLDSSGNPSAVGAIGQGTAPNGSLMSAVIGPNGCLGGYTANYKQVGCAPPLPPTSGASLLRVAWTQSLAAYANGRITASSWRNLDYAPSFTGPFVLLNPQYVDDALPPVSALEVGTTEWGASALLGGVLLFQNGAVLPPDSTTQPNIPMSNVRDLSLFGSGAEVGLLIATDGGVYVSDLSSGSPTAPQKVLSADVATGVSLNVGQGSANGDGYGAAVAWTGGVSTLYRAVPNPSAPGRSWVAATMPPVGLTAPLQRAVCSGSQTCVLLTGADAGSNVAVLVNQGRPVLPTETLNIDEGQRLVTTVSVTDPDGDPVYVTWTPPGANSLLALAPDAGSLDNRDITMAAGVGLCGSQYAPFSVPLVASDGLAAHDTAGQLSVLVKHVVPLPAPVLTSATLSVPAGTSANEIVPQPGSSCPPTYTWNRTSGTLAYAQDGDALSLTVPPYACSPQTSTFTVTASDGFVAPSAPATLTVTVQPYGLPSAPFADGARQSVDAGTSVVITPQQLHPCGLDSSAVSTTWTFDAGTVTGAQMSPAGNPTVPQVTVKTPECVTGTAMLTAYNTLDAGLIGPTATLALDVAPVLTPVSAVSLELDGGYVEQHAAFEGPTAAPEANCPKLRDLSAELTLLDDAGVQVGSQSVRPGAPFSFPVPGCSGGNFTVRGHVVESGVAGPDSDLPVTAPVLALGVNGLSPNTLTAVCGQGAKGTVQVVVDTRHCPSADFTWQRTAGPVLQSDTLSGSQVEVATAETGLDALVGNTITMNVTASSPGVSTVPAAQPFDLTITADPFITVSHRAEPVASEAQVLHVAVDLHNTTACGVSTVELVESLEGMTYVPGSARVNGVPVDANESGGQLHVPQIPVDASGTTTVTYAAHAKLFGSPTPSGRAWLRSVPVSAQAGLSAPRAACGCSGAEGAPLVGLGLIALQLLGRRKRTRSSPNAR